MPGHDRPVHVDIDLPAIQGAVERFHFETRGTRTNQHQFFQELIQARLRHHRCETVFQLLLAGCAKQKQAGLVDPVDPHRMNTFQQFLRMAGKIGLEIHNTLVAQSQQTLLDG